MQFRRDDSIIDLPPRHRPAELLLCRWLRERLRDVVVHAAGDWHHQHHAQHLPDLEQRHGLPGTVTSGQCLLQPNGAYAAVACQPVPLTTAPPPPVKWVGTYAVQAGCSTATCCCLTGTVTVTQSGLTVSFSGSVAGQCGGSTSYSGSATLSSLSSTSASFTLLGQQFTATRSGRTVSVQNLAAPLGVHRRRVLLLHLWRRLLLCVVSGALPHARGAAGWPPARRARRRDRPAAGATSGDAFARLYGTYTSDPNTLGYCQRMTNGACTGTCCVLNATLTNVNSPNVTSIKFYIDPATASRCRATQPSWPYISTDGATIEARFCSWTFSTKGENVCSPVRLLQYRRGMPEVRGGAAHTASSHRTSL